MSVKPNAKLIDSLRKRKGWTIEDFAGESGLALRTVQNAIAGIGVGIKTLKIIADCLGVEYESLLVPEAMSETSVNIQQNPVTISEEADGSVSVTILTDLIFGQGESVKSKKIQSIRIYYQDILPKNAGLMTVSVANRLAVSIAMPIEEILAVGIEGFEHVTSQFNHLVRTADELHRWAISVRDMEAASRRDHPHEIPKRRVSSFSVVLPLVAGEGLPAEAVQIAASLSLLNTLSPQLDSIHQAINGCNITYSMEFLFCGELPEK